MCSISSSDEDFPVPSELVLAVVEPEELDEAVVSEDDDVVVVDSALCSSSFDVFVVSVALALFHSTSFA